MRLLLIALAACTPEHFGDPAQLTVFTVSPRDLETIYSNSEDATGVAFWAFQTLPPAAGRIEVEIAGEFQPLAAYSRTLTSTHDGVVIGAILPGQHNPPNLRVVLHAPERVFSVTPKTRMHRTNTLVFSTRFSQDDANLDVEIKDPFGRFELGQIARTFDVSVRDTTCATAVTTTPNTQLNTRLPVPFPLAFDYCVRVDTGLAVHDQHAVPRVLLQQSQRVISPMPLTAPVRIVPVFDLELSDPTSCTHVTEALTAVIQATPGVDIAAPIDLSASAPPEPNCRHKEDSGITLDDFRDRVQTFLGVDGIVLMVLVTNVNQVPSRATQDLFAAAAALIMSSGTRLDLALLGPSEASSPTFIRTAPWSYAADPRLPETLADMLSEVVPYRRYEHPLQTAYYPYFTDPIPADWFGFKVCDQNRAIETTVALQPYAKFVDPPGAFRFDLTTEWQPSFAFAVQTATLDLEVCVQFCDQAQGMAWRSQEACGNTP